LFWIVPKSYSYVLSSLKTYPDQERTLKILIWAVSAAVLLLVVAMRRYTLPVPDAWDVGFLPAVNATLNTLTASH